MIYWRRAKRTRLHDSMRTISDSWYRASDELQCMHGFGTELIRNLAIWLAVSQDYHLFIYKVYWYILSMSVPIFTSFGIENASLHSGGPRKLLPLISLSYFFYFMTPVFQHGASLVLIIMYMRTKYTGLLSIISQCSFPWCNNYGPRTVPISCRCHQHCPGPIFCLLLGSKLRLRSANHRAGYFSNLACDWLSIVWAYSKQETENGPWLQPGYGPICMTSGCIGISHVGPVSK